MKVNEIFFSIQGESTRAGWPCVFIRLTGCNLRCSYCDTKYAYDSGTEMPVSQVGNKVLELCPPEKEPLVEITGGEPLLQQEQVIELIEFLLGKGYCKPKLGSRILIETNGTIRLRGRMADKEWRRGVVSIVADVKTFSSETWKSGEFTPVSHIFDQLTVEDEVKFVIANRKDYDFAKLVCVAQKLVGRKLRKVKAVHFSPCAGTLAPRTLAEWILEDQWPVHFQLQQHKYIWPPTMRGV